MTLMTYSPLRDILSAINTQIVDAAQYAILLDNADIASRRIDNLLASEFPYFLPYLGSWEVPIDGQNINSNLNTLDLGFPLLEFTSISVSGQDYTSHAAIYPSTAFPIERLRLTSFDFSWYDNGLCDPAQMPVIVTNGVRGYRRRGGTRWLAVGTLHANIDASVTSIEVDSLDTVPVPLSGETANLSAGHLLKIGSEYLVKDYSATGQTVERGVNGTTAASHTAGDTVYVFQVEEPIRRVAARQAGLMLARRGGYDVRSANEVGTPIIFPSDLLAELYDTVSPYGR